MIVPMDLAHAIVLSRQMAPIFRAEREMTCDVYSPDAHAVHVFQTATYGAVRLNDDGRPVLAGGLMGSGPGVVHTFLFGAEGWEAALGELIKHTRKVITETLTVERIHRVQCVSPCLHKDSRKFFRLMGLAFEHELRGYGKGGESFYMFARVREHAAEEG